MRKAKEAVQLFSFYRLRNEVQVICSRSHSYLGSAKSKSNNIL